jgi:putative transcriptional regulator
MIINRTGEIAREQGLTVQALADRAGVVYNTAHALYTGSARRVGFEVLDRICKALNVQPGDLLVRVDTEESRHE